MKTTPFNDILKKQMKSNTFAIEYKKELKKIKEKSKQREAERIIEGLELPNFHKEKMEVPNIFLLGVFIGMLIPIIHYFIVMPLLTNL